MYSSTVSIEELNVGGGRSARAVLLCGAGLPFQGAEWGTEAVIPTTWYPGNGDEATQQTLGPKELPSEWQGEWKRTQLARSGCKITDETGQEIGVFAPQQLRDALDAIFREGARLRVTWRVTAGSDGDQTANGVMVREGRCKTWKFPHTRLQDIGWSFEFAWASRGKRTQKPVSARDASLVINAAAMNAANSAVTSAVAAGRRKANMRKSATHFTIGQLSALADAPSKFATSFSRALLQTTNQLRDLSNLAAKLKSLPFATQVAAENLASKVIVDINSFADAVGQVPAELLSTIPSVSAQTRAVTYYGGVTDAVNNAAEKAQTLSEQMRAITNAATANRGVTSSRANSGATPGSIIAVHITHTGDTPTSVSMKYYGSPDHCIDILKCNRLPWHQATFVAGKPLIIPVLATSNGASGV